MTSLTTRGLSLLVPIALLLAAPSAAAQEPGVPPIPMDIPVLLVGDPRINGLILEPYEGTWAVGTIHKDRQLRLAERIEASNLSQQKLERVELDGREVWRRTIIQRAADTGEELITALIYMELVSLRPIRALASQPNGARVGYEYDWDQHVIRPFGAADDRPPLMSMDLEMLEAAAHEAWMAVLPYRNDFTAKIPVMMASAGAKYWAAPRVVGTEEVDIGDGIDREAWVVELDWWGMGSDTSYFPGGGRNDSGGTGGKYWILKDPPPAVGHLFRVRTEFDENTDVVVQLQGSR
jgi:hypothetical protein